MGESLKNSNEFLTHKLNVFPLFRQTLITDIGLTLQMLFYCFKRNENYEGIKTYENIYKLIRFGLKAHPTFLEVMSVIIAQSYKKQCENTVANRSHSQLSIYFH